MSNPLVDRFGRDLSDEEICQKVYVGANPIPYLHEYEVNVAAALLKDELCRIFYPTQQVIKVLKKLRSMAFAHSKITYESVESFIKGVYGTRKQSTPQNPMCITGLAGVGKTAIMQAIPKIMPEPMDLDPSVANHIGFRVSSLWSYTVKSRANTLGQLETAHGALYNTKREKLDQKMTPNLAYCNGISLITVDELQSLTASSNAATATTKVLLEHMQMGPPLVYCCNFSLIHKFIKRPQEDRNRLLSERLLITPDENASVDWLGTLAEYKLVAPDCFKFNLESDADAIYKYTYGIKRYVVSLLVIAYQLAREKGSCVVGIKEIEMAYNSTSYEDKRADVQTLKRQELLNKCLGPKDLFYPYGKSEPITLAKVDQQRKELSEAVSEKMAIEILPVSEKRELGVATKVPTYGESFITKPKPIRIRRPSEEEMLEDAIATKAQAMEEVRKSKSG